MTYPISDISRRVIYSGSAGVGPYSFSFEVLGQGDVAVYLNSTLLTITTDYTVSINANGTGSITLVTAATASDTVAILGNKGIERQTDFVTGGDLFANSLNDELDAQTIFAQQNAEAVSRALKLPPYSSLSINSTLPVPQANYILGWNSTADGILNYQAIGTYKGTDATTTTADYVFRDLVKSTTTAQLDNVYICIQDSPSGTALTNTSYWALLVDAVSAATSATNAATSASAAATSATASATSATASATSATASAGSATAAAGSATAAAGSATAAAGSATAAANDAAAAAALLDLFDDAYLGAKASDPTLDNDGNALADGALYFDTTNNAMKVYDLGTTTWFRLTPTVAAQTAINAVAAIAADVTTVAAIDSDVTAVAGVSADVTSVAGVSADVTTVAGISSDVTAVAADATDIGTVAANIADVSAVAAIDSDVTTVATNVTDVVTFATTYLGAFASAPTTTVTGALYYDTTGSQLYVWNGSSWDAAAFSASGTVTSFNTRTGAITLSSSDVTTALGFTPVDVAGDNMTGNLTVTGIMAADVVRVKQAAIAASTAATTLDFDTANDFNVSLSSSTTFTFNNPTAGQQGVIYLTQDGTGGHTITLPAIAKTPLNGATIVQDTGAGNTSILSYTVLDSSNVLVNYIGDFA